MRGVMRFVSMLGMLPLPAAIAGSLLAAIGIGVHLGDSSIDLIDPIHFQGPALHPRDRGVALDPRQVRARSPLYAEHYGWEEGRLALAACEDCAMLNARDALPSAPPDPGHYGELASGAEAADEAVQVHRGQADAEPAAPRIERAEPEYQIMSYASAPVSIEEEEMPPVPDWESNGRAYRP